MVTQRLYGEEPIDSEGPERKKPETTGSAVGGGIDENGNGCVSKSPRKVKLRNLLGSRKGGTCATKKTDLKRRIEEVHRSWIYTKFKVKFTMKGTTRQGDYILYREKWNIMCPEETG